MPFKRPTLDEAITAAQAEIADALSLSGLILQGGLAAIGAAVGGQSNLLHGHLDWLSKQTFIPSAETDTEELERIASLWAIYRKQATGATGLVRFTGTSGILIAAGTELARADGVIYTTDSDATLSSGVADVAVTATVEEGASGSATSASVGTTLTMQAEVAGVSSTVTVIADGDGAGLKDGTDDETDEELLQRLFQRVRNVPAGGAAADYVRWALEVPGVTRAWVISPWAGIGTVGVGFVVDNDATGPFPSPSKVAEVDAYLNDTSRRPITADVSAFAPVELDLDAAIAVTPNTTAVQDAVNAALDDLLLREASVGGTVQLSHIRQAISNAPGVLDFTMSSPTADVVAGAAELLVRGTTTFS